MDRVVLAVTGCLAFAVANANDRVCTVLARFHPIASGLVNGECEIGSVDFENVVTIKAAHANIESARGKLDLSGSVIKI